MKNIKNDKIYNRTLICMLILYAFVWVVLAINPYDRADWLLENILVFLLLIYLASTFKVFKYTIPSYSMFFIFLLLHTYGAHYSYTTTPIDEFIHKFISFKRDNFDRIVHFSFGLLLVYPIKEMIERIVKVKKLWANIFSVLTILAFAGFYELIEMWVAVIFVPELGPLFLGTQGDVWDTQHDIELAFFGSMLTITLSSVLELFFGRAKAGSHQHDVNM